MLGEIFGSSAGLTRFEVTLFRFLDDLPDFESTFPLVFEKNAGLLGDEMALSMGLGLGFPDCAEAPDGVDSGPSLGVFRATSLGVSWSSSWIAVSSRDSWGLSKEASGKVKSSNAGGTSASPKVGDG